jgi:hypothetical protein
MGHQLGSSHDDASSATDAEQRIPDRISHRDRAVTQGDFQDVAASDPGTDVGRVDATSTQPSTTGIEKDPLGARGIEKDPLGVRGHSQGSTVGPESTTSGAQAPAHEATHTVQQSGGSGGGEGSGTRAQDYNSSRSNSTSRGVEKDDFGAPRDSSTPGVEKDDFGAPEESGTRAQDYNSSRSNSTSRGVEKDDLGAPRDSSTPGVEKDDLGAPKDSSTPDAEGQEQAAKKGDTRKSGNESSAIGTLR